MKTEWHWIKDNDFPEEGQRVWCCSAWAGLYCMGDYMFSKDLYTVDECEFAQYKDKRHAAFFGHDSEYGFYEEDNVLCWCELPTLPDELVVGNHCHA